jgi:hypothetical protein
MVSQGIQSPHCPPRQFRGSRTDAISRWELPQVETAIASRRSGLVLPILSWSLFRSRRCIAVTRVIREVAKAEAANKVITTLSPAAACWGRCWPPIPATGNRGRTAGSGTYILGPHTWNRYDSDVTDP